MSVLLVVLVLASTYRLTRLVTADQITLPVRRWASTRSTWLGYLTTCDWCLSIWIGPIPATLAIAYPSNRLVWMLLLALSASSASGLLSLLEGRLERE